MHTLYTILNDKEVQNAIDYAVNQYQTWTQAVDHVMFHVFCEKCMIPGSVTVENIVRAALKKHVKQIFNDAQKIRYASLKLKNNTN